MTDLLDDVAFETAVGAIADRIRAAAAEGTKLAIRGGGTKDFFGNPLQGEALDIGVLKAPLIHESSELVVTAAAATPLAELEATLDAAGQMLAFEPPHFGAAVTVGGCVAAGLCGPRRLASGYAGGPLRDHVLGTKLLDGRGNLLSFGGTVIKNVAGYDVSRLLAGSLGILGVIVEVSLKVVPKPTDELTLVFECDEVTAIDRYGEWNRQPWPVSASAWIGGRLWLRLSGAAVAIAATHRAIGGDMLSPHAAADFWLGVREHRHEFFETSATESLWRLSLPFDAAVLPDVTGITGGVMHEWHGMQRWIKLRAKDYAATSAVHELAHRYGGHATRFRGGDRATPAFAPLAPVNATIHRRLKDEFDPQGVFNPGRLQPDL